MGGPLHLQAKKAKRKWMTHATLKVLLPVPRSTCTREGGEENCLVLAMSFDRARIDLNFSSAHAEIAQTSAHKHRALL